MNRKYQRMLSMLLAIFLLVSGMCLENSKADSQSLSSLQEQKVCLKGSLDEALDYVEPRAEGMFGQQNFSSVVGVSASHNFRKDTKQSFVYLLVNISVHNLIPIHITENTIVSPEKHCENVILSYIHNQDGKK